MKVDPDKTPDSYRSLEVVESYKFDNEDRSIDINKCTDNAGNVYFHVVQQPPIEEISSYKDIIVHTAFTVSSDETENEVYRQADNSAREHYGDLDV